MNTLSVRLLGIALGALGLLTAKSACAVTWTADAYTLATGDFNGDGKDDLLVIAKDPSLPSGIALGDGSGQPSVLSQSWASNYLGITWSGGTYIPHIGDFDGDNRDDIFLQRVSGGNQYVLMPDANNQFTSIHQTITNSDLGIGWSAAERRIEVGDFNNNGLDDLYLQSNTVGVDNAVLLAASGGYFSSVAHTWVNSYLTLEWALAKAIDYAGDFNGDGRSDLLVQAKPNWVMIPFDDLSIPVPTYRPESYGIGLSDATGKVTSVSDTWNHDNLGLEWSPLQYDIFVGNFNGNADGAYCADVLLQAKRAGMASYIVLMNCAGTVPTGATVYTLSPGYLGLNWDATSYQFQIGDFNGDGRSDIYMQAPAGGTNRIAYAASNGNITATPVTHSPSGAFKKPVPGALPGQFNVGNQGEGTDSIPIEAPAGAGGLQPNLALTYNHLAGNGLAGMRWALSGLSAITRCQTTFAQDGSVAPVNDTSTDRFCLDGNRLVGYSGTYGANNAQYRTELETFQRIVQTGEQAGGNGPTSFRVDHTNGVSSYYGTTDDSRLGTGSNPVRTWYLSYSEDQFGNRINYTYDENTTTGETVPTIVAWTQNSATPTPKYKITITYEARPGNDVRNGVDVGGAPWARTKRIDKIDVTYDTQLIRTYDLTYNPALATGVGTGRSQLKEVTVCGPDECLPATSFSVQSGTSGWNGLVDSGLAAGTGGLVGDVNGDGRQDLVVSLSGTWQVYLGQANGTLSGTLNTTYSSATNPGAARIIDFNGDGLADLLYQSSTTWRVARWTGSAFTSDDTGVSISSPDHADVRDFDGDGRQDWLYRDGSLIKWRRNTGGAFAAAQTLVVSTGDPPYWVANEGAPDVNGDGRDDLIIRGVACEPNPYPVPPSCIDMPMWSVLVATGSGYTSILNLHSPFNAAIGNLRSADINGDGLDDLIFAYGTSVIEWYTMLSDGTGFYASVNTHIPATINSVIADYDNDGRADLIWGDGDYWRVHLSDGSTWATSYADSIPSAGAGTSGGFAADISGDGFPEIVRVSGTTWQTHKHKTALPDVVTTFTDGLGAATNVTYASLADSAANYTMSNPGSPPAYVHAFIGPRHVVAAESHDNGVGGTRVFAHKYDTAYTNVAGRGWLSFYSHRVEETRAGGQPPGRRTTRTFDRTFPNAGLVTNEVVQLNTVTGELISDSTNTLATAAQYTYTDTTPNRYFPRVEFTSTSDYAAGGSALRTTEVDPTYDGTVSTPPVYGVVTQVARSVSQTSPTSQTWQSVTAFDPGNFITSTEYCIGLPGLLQVTNTLPDTTTAVRKIRHTFTAADCSLYQTTDESDSSTAKQLRTTYTYDAYGNVDVVSQNSVTPSQARSTDFTFDANGQFPISATLGTVNLTTSFTWDYLRGKRASVTGADQLTASFLYDNFGRLKRETNPAASTDYSLYDCYGTCWPQYGKLFVHAQGSDGSDGYEFLDKLQRPVGKSWTLPLGTQGRRETRYDAYGRVDRASQPYVYLDPVFWITYQYDSLDRTTQEDAPVSEAHPSGATTIYQYSGRDVWITDAENHQTKYSNNALGQIAQVIDALSGTSSYTYKHFGELGGVVDAEGNSTTIGYDPRGYKSSMADPNLGMWAYDYNVYGELEKQRNAVTSAPSWTTQLAFDAAGRMSTRTETEGTTTFSYHTSGAGALGKPSAISTTDYSEQYTYSTTLGQPTQIRRTIEGTAYDFDMTYDGQGRLDVLTYPSSTGANRFKVDYDYDYFGHMNAAKDGNTGAVFYTLSEADALGREVNVSLGNNASGNVAVSEYFTFDRASGRLTDIDTGPSLSSSIQNLSFTWDEVGNLKSRTNQLISKTENFGYDALDRLTSAQVVGQTAVTVDYSASGRITQKSDVGAYTYNPSSHPYAVTAAGGVSYVYDANGRMTSRGGKTLTWYSYDLPKQLAAGTKTTDFSYGVGRERYKQVQKTGATTDSTIYYVGTLFEKEIAGATTTYRHYVNARGRMIATVSRVGAAETVQYLHRDHQGSVVEVTAANGTLVQSLAFDAWGLRRNAATWAALGSPFGGSEVTERGYTGHEHLDSAELIHMNGRVQDPRIGRFLSADPTVPSPFNSQSLNRYTYVLNNPLSRVDPSGFDDEVVVTGKRPQVPVGPPRFSGGGGGDSGMDEIALLWMCYLGHQCNDDADSAAPAEGQQPEGNRPPDEIVVTGKCSSGAGGACSASTDSPVWKLVRTYLDWRQANIDHQLELIDAIGRGDKEATQEFAENFIGGGTSKIVKGLLQEAAAAKAVMFASRNASELKTIYGWGKGLEGVQGARNALDATAMARIQGSLGRAEVEAARDLYRAAAAGGKGGEVAVQRAEYMEEILQLWK